MIVIRGSRQGFEHGVKEEVQVIAIASARLIDGTGGPAIDDAMVQIENGTLRYVGTAAAAPPLTPGAELIDLGNTTLLPGYIDSHVHPAGLEGRRPRGNDANPFSSAPGRAQGGERFNISAAIDAVPALTTLLQSGVTTARNPGSPGLVGYELRAGVMDSVLAGPELIVAGRILCPTGGHGHIHGIEADGPVGVRTATRQLFKEGADFIKLTASGGGTTAGTLMGQPTFSVAEIRSAVDEAQQHGSYVTAHCHSREGIERCLDAGVGMIEHATFYDESRIVDYSHEIASRIRDLDVTISPTIAVHARWLESVEARTSEMSAARLAYWQWSRESFKRRLDNLARFRELGIPLVIGSDAPAGGVPFGDFPFGIVLHFRAGASALEAIASATGVAAARLGIAARTGTLTAGLSADIIALDGNPLTDIHAVERVAFVMQAGSVVRAFTPGPSNDHPSEFESSRTSTSTSDTERRTRL